MNVKRFTGRTSREAMQKVKAAFGDDAVVLSTKPAPDGGVEIMAMGADGVAQIERLPAERHEPVDQTLAKPAKASSAHSARNAVASLATTVQEDVRQLAMSTLSFQDYVRERMLKRRQAALKARLEPELAPSPEDQLQQRVAPSAARQQAQSQARAVADEHLDLSAPALPAPPAKPAPSWCKRRSRPRCKPRLKLTCKWPRPMPWVLARKRPPKPSNPRCHATSLKLRRRCQRKPRRPPIASPGPTRPS